MTRARMARARRCEVFDTDDQRREAEARASEQSRVPVAGAEGWFYLPFEHLEDSDEHRITLVRNEHQIAMTLPLFIDKGDELGEIALLVIRAHERWREEKGLGA